jgi:hypothetical protein
MKRIFPLLAVVPLALVLSASTCHKPGDCSGVMCTAVFSMITVEVRNADGTQASLDSTVTVSASGNPIAKNDANSSAGIYTVIDDGYQRSLSNRTEQVTFKGFRAGKEIISQNYSVTADCCHVSKESGPSTLTLP